MTRPVRPTHSAALLAVAICTAAAFAQLEQQPDYTPVEPGLSDQNPLSGPGRFVAPDLRQAFDFDRVYRVGDSNLFARRSGGLTAVFNRSVYDDTRFGEVPVIPPGTVFYIGDPPQAFDAPAPRRHGGIDRRVETRVDQRVETRPGGRTSRQSAPFQSIRIDLRPAERAMAWLRDAPFWSQLGRY